MSLTLDCFELISLEELQIPKDYYKCLVNHYWLVVNGKALIYTRFGSYSPQCNVNEQISLRLREKIYPNAEVVKIPVAFVKNRI